ncbi:GGDEF domain-containing protein [Azospirillum rugosum]|uniref:diguanylate cyclase n=1 Tax=Azospirillum rugosum TaxID=416170 RepID=A0ABS4SDZ4_9PROT|nr:GGDEF domain-containing protein [Azospirillum rugosum]MBP2290796.1 diguanylate cyclase (GGDEF)-like protein [Azospirillum rugosum]MDQ0529663.1 diguanylate cyclase (GGDEF)-like protein [Azospirillum rugosum]
MPLDTRTLVIVLVGLGVLLTTAAMLTWRAHRHIVALGYWAAGALIGVIGMSLVMFYSVLPAGFVIPLSNGMVAATYVLNWFGVRSFGGRPIPWRTGFAAFVLLTAGNAYFVVVDDDIIARILIGSAGIAALSLLAALELWRMGPPGAPRRAKRTTALVFALHAAFVIVRAAMMPGAGPLEHLLAPNLLNGIAFLEAILAVTAWSLGFLAMTSERLQADLDQLATIDPLTGAFNRRAFFRHAEREIARARRTGEPLALLLLDLDRFKRINDRFGHQAGDELLRAFAETVTARLRKSDLFGRYGGEEFCLLLPNTDRTGARTLAEGLRVDFARRAVDFDGQRIIASVSIGIAECGSSADLDTALADADTALYQAKRNGRNQVAVSAQAG